MLNGNGGEESKIAERQRERVCVRGGKWWKRRDRVSHKMSRKRNTFGEINVGLISKISKIPEGH
jgi:hypothetical protein